MFLCGGMRARSRMEAAFVLIMSLVSSGRFLVEASISATIFLYGIFVGANANFGPFCSKERSASVRGFCDKLITQSFLTISACRLYSFRRFVCFFSCLAVILLRTEVDRCFKKLVKLLKVEFGRHAANSCVVL